MGKYQINSIDSIPILKIFPSKDIELTRKLIIRSYNFVHKMNSAIHRTNFQNWVVKCVDHSFILAAAGSK